MSPAARVRTVLLLAVLALGLTVPVASAAPRAAAAPVIAAGVTAGGVDVGGLTEAQATTKLEQQLGPRMALPVVVRVGSRAFKLSHGPGQFVLDAGRMARGALKIPALPAGTEATGGAAPGGDRAVGLSIKHSQAAVNRFVAGIADAVYLAPRNATLRMTTTRMRLTRQRGGRHIDTAATAKLVNAALDSLTASRGLRVRTTWTPPSTTTSELRRAYPKVITVDRGTFRLRLFTHLAFTKSYGVAVGMAGLSTPAGTYHITDKQIDPAWHVPNSAWAGSLAGQVIPGGAADNPLKARWMGLVDGVGIHGTSEDWSIGSAASHGCIRMHVADVEDLYRRVSVGTPVLIK